MEVGGFARDARREFSSTTWIRANDHDLSRTGKGHGSQLTVDAIKAETILQLID